MKQYLYLLSLPLIFFTSCSRYYYKPNAVNTPLFTDGGQAHLAFCGSGGGTEDNDGGTAYFDVQGSYSPIKHLGIIANYSTYKFNADNPNPNSGNVDARAHLLEAGIGGYMPVGERKAKFVTELYVGGGGGKISSDVDMKIRRLFVQPGLGLHSPWVDASFALRISNVKFSDLNANGRSDDYLMQQDLISSDGRRIDKGSYTFYEPCFTVRGGYKFAKVQLQMVISDNVSSVPWNYNPVRFTAGFYLSIEDIVEMSRSKQ